MKFKSTVLIVLLSFFVIACGGGGGGSDSPPTPPPTLNSIAIAGIESSYIVGEQDTVTVNGTYSNGSVSAVSGAMQLGHPVNQR